jgi:hypothetical protein
MNRLPDWPQRLEAAVEAARLQPFRWGQHDCALWAADVTLQITGVDYAQDFRGRYRTQRQALAIIARRGGLAAIATKALGYPVRITQARRGDVCLVCRDSGPSLGICIGDRAAFTGPQGLALLPLLECEQAWHV